MYEEGPVFVANPTRAEFVVMVETVGVGLVRFVPLGAEAKVNVDIEPGSDDKNMTPSPIATRLIL